MFYKQTLHFQLFTYLLGVDLMYTDRYFENDIYLIEDVWRRVIRTPTVALVNSIYSSEEIQTYFILSCMSMIKEISITTTSVFSLLINTNKSISILGKLQTNPFHLFFLE